MIELIIGYPNSGKSEYAEAEVIRLAANNKKYYLATMIPFGEDGLKRVEKHRLQRQGKGFETIEKARAIHEIDDLQATGTVLIECLSNLLANELYASDNIDKTDELIVEDIVNEIMLLSEKLANTIIVSNEFAEDAEGYDESTRRYVKLMQKLNEELSLKVNKTYRIK